MGGLVRLFKRPVLEDLMTRVTSTGEDNKAAIGGRKKRTSCAGTQKGIAKRRATE